MTEGHELDMTVTAKQTSQLAATPEAVDAKTNIVLVAERLFAECGINGKSLREIAAAAGQRNHYAVQYHFGSREGLVQAIFDHRMLEMEPIRRRMLAQARLQGRLGDIRALVEIIYLPQLELRDEDGRHSYAGFLAQYLQRARSQHFGEFSSKTPPELATTLSLLRKRVDHLPEAVAQRRLIAASFMFVHILVHHGDPEWSNRDGERFESAVADTLDQIARCLLAPLPSG